MSLSPQERRAALRNARKLLDLMESGDIGLKSSSDNELLKELLAEFEFYLRQRETPT
jgi:hypothetical protein